MGRQRSGSMSTHDPALLRIRAEMARHGMLPHQLASREAPTPPDEIMRFAVWLETFTRLAP